MFFIEIVCLFTVIKSSKNYRLIASLATDPKSKVVKYHLRFYWNHRDDEDFQARVEKGFSKPMPSDEPTWKACPRGIALNLEDLTEFLQADWAGLLLNTIGKSSFQ